MSNNIIVESKDFENGLILAICVEIRDITPYFYVSWKTTMIGTRSENFADIKRRYNTVLSVLYDVFGWDYCDECGKMEAGVKKYSVMYENGMTDTLRLCPHLHAGYCEKRMHDDSDISTITEVENNE